MMQNRVFEGDYAYMGTRKVEDRMLFTFEGEKEDTCAVVLVDKSNQKENRIVVPEEFCRGSLRSVAIEGIDEENTCYYFEINGKKQMDPYARAVAGREQWADLNRKQNVYRIYGKFQETSFDWKNDIAPEVPKNQMVMYKLHVRGFTMDEGKAVSGTFQGLERKLDYLKNLGITTVELMPVYEFEELSLPVQIELPDYVKWTSEKEDKITPKMGEDGKVSTNMWGYVAGNYFAVKASYGSDSRHASNEFRHLVRSMHEKGMECVMEMFFPETVNHNLILEAIRFWVKEYHIDGVHLLGENLPITAITQDLLLSRTKIFYTGFTEVQIKREHKYKNLYVYKEEYLYPARKILNHMNGDIQEFIDQQRKQGGNVSYVNYIASNNGFTLADLFMYNDKHNEANGEDNMDGNAWNFSNNCGVEGPTRKRYILDMRRRQWRNAMVMVFMAQGIPMVWSGDEMSNSQAGNNNAYCQDNPIGWINWRNNKSQKEDQDFITKLIQLRKSHPILTGEDPFQFSDYAANGIPDVSLHGESAWISGIQPGRMSLGMMYCGAYAKKEANNEDVYIGYNFFSGISTLALPKLKGKRKWYLVVNTADKTEPFHGTELLYKDQQQLTLSPQSICILLGR